MAKFDTDLINQLFRVADEDRDGAVGGAEAVKFFARSGLPQECLVQVWELASGGAPKLNTAQFGAALRLVSLAQVSGGRVPLEQARSTLAGLGPVLPVPGLAGLEQYGVPATAFAPKATAGYSAQATGGYQPQATGSYAPQPTGGYSAQATGGYSAQATGGYTAQGTGGYTSQPTGGYSAQGTGGYTAQPTGGYTAQPTGGYTAQPTGGYTAQPTGGYTAQPTGSYAAQPTGGYTAQPTGSYVAQPTGGYVAQNTGGQYPPPNAADVQRYQAMFMQLDTDRDGIVQGSDCFSAFLQWGLEKAVLKEIWDKVAGDAGYLTAPQFMQALNLMDLARKAGGRLPPPMQQAPPPQPPQSAPKQWTLASQFGDRSAVAATAAPVVPVAPIPPARFEYQEPAAVVAEAPPPSRVPALPVNAGLTDIESAKLEREAKEAAAKEAELRVFEEEAAKSKARIKAYSEALQELAVFKSRNNVALMEAQDQASRLTEEAAAIQRKYELAYNASKNAGEASQQAVDKVQGLLKGKAEAEEKLRALQQEIAQADHQLAPAQMYQLEHEVAALQLQVEQAEVFRRSKLQQVDAMRGQRRALESRLTEVQDALRHADEELQTATVEVARLQAAAEQLRAQGTSGGQAQAMLVRAARAYRSLLATVLRCGMELPFEADLLNNGGLLVQGKNESTGALLAWMDDVMAGVADWGSVDASTQGYVLVNATDARLPPAALLPSLSRSYKTAVTPAPLPAPSSAPAPPPAPPLQGFGEDGDGDGFGGDNAFGGDDAFAGDNAFGGDDAFGGDNAFGSGRKEEGEPVQAAPVGPEVETKDPTEPAGIDGDGNGFEGHDEAARPEAAAASEVAAAGDFTEPAAAAAIVPVAPAHSPLDELAFSSAAPEEQVQVEPRAEGSHDQDSTAPSAHAARGTAAEHVSELGARISAGFASDHTVAEPPPAAASAAASTPAPGFDDSALDSMFRAPTAAVAAAASHQPMAAVAAAVPHQPPLAPVPAPTPAPQAPKPAAPAFTMAFDDDAFV